MMAIVSPKVAHDGHAQRGERGAPHAVSVDEHGAQHAEDDEEPRLHAEPVGCLHVGEAELVDHVLSISITTHTSLGSCRSCSPLRCRKLPQSADSALLRPRRSIRTLTCCAEPRSSGSRSSVDALGERWKLAGRPLPLPPPKAAERREAKRDMTQLRRLRGGERAPSECGSVGADRRGRRITGRFLRGKSTLNYSYKRARPFRLQTPRRFELLLHAL
eukprot:scaffold45007_cov59-Phaeocystis_antarctica.AAC.4